MTILGFNFKSISAHTKNKFVSDKVNVNSNPNITGIEKKDLSAVGAREAVEIQFEFITSYDPDVGEIRFEGEVLYGVDDAKRVMKLWKEEKKFDDKIAVDVLNLIFRKCLSKAVELSDALRLPPPVRFPTVTADKMGK